jgi:hypothetical protein
MDKAYEHRPNATGSQVAAPEQDRPTAMALTVTSLIQFPALTTIFTARIPAPLQKNLK